MKKILCVILSCLVLVSSCILTSCGEGEKISWRYVRKIVKAIQNEDYETFDRLLTNTRYSVDGYAKSWFRRKLDDESEIFSTLDYRHSALEEACIKRNAYFVKELLERGADPNFSTWPEAWSPLECVSYGNSEDRNRKAYEVFKLLFEYGADLNACSSSVTPVYGCVSFYNYIKGENKDEAGLLRIIELFMENGADPTKGTYFGKSAYDYAVEHELYEVLEIIKPRVQD